MYPAMYMPQYQYQQRQEYMPQPVMQTPVQQANNSMSIRLVASRAEAETMQIPFDGTTHFFYDTSCGKMYSKTFNGNTGAAPLITYSRDAEVVTTAPQYVTMEEFNAFKEEMTKRPTGKAAKKDDAE